MDNPNSAYDQFFLYRDRVSSLNSLDNWKEILSIDAGNGYLLSYAPFDYINTKAKIVVVGITPGAYQAEQALNSMQRNLAHGMDEYEVLRTAKSFASFSGAMRNNLVAMLDHISVNDLLDLESCASLFDNKNTVAHFTSVIRYPLFKNGKNYSGTPSPLKIPQIREYVDQYFGQEIKQLPDALYIPLGPKVAEVLRHYIDSGLLEEQQVLDGMPHPSGANAERIAYFLGNKKAEDCSSKTNTQKIDAAKTRLIEKIAIDPFLAGLVPIH